MPINLEPQITFQEQHAAKVIDFGVTPTGDLYWLEIINTPEYRDETNCYAVIVPSNINHYVIKYRKDNQTHEIKVEGIQLNFHFLVPLSFPDFWLVGCARSRFDRQLKVGQNNIRTVDADGNILDQFCFGDGIRKIYCLNEEIWTSYFDEGIYGNYGWEIPIGQNGLVAWDQMGEVIYRYGGDYAYITDMKIIHMDFGCSLNSDQKSIYISHKYKEIEKINEEANDERKIESLKLNDPNPAGIIDFCMMGDKFLIQRTNDSKLDLFKNVNNSLEYIQTLEVCVQGQQIPSFRFFSNGQFTNGQYMTLMDDKSIYLLNMADYCC